jgi:hypothetical protein
MLPINLGRLYYLHGYEEHKNILLDVIDYIFPAASELISTNAPERVETILQKYTKNTPTNKSKQTDDGLILHLVNLTGCSGNSYFEPLPIYQLNFKIKADFKPSKVFSMVNQKPINFSWENGFVSFQLNKLNAFDGIVMDR